MANANTPFGFRPVRHMNAGPYNGAVEHFSALATNGTAFYIGDPVTLVGTSQTINGRVYRDVLRSSTGGVIVGVVVGVLPVTADSVLYRAASTQRIVMVATDPLLVFEIQEVSGGTALTADDAGFNANFIIAAGSAITGLSGTQVDNVGEANTNTLDLKLIGPVARENNAIGENCKWEVMINRHQYANQVAGV